ncbi:MAG: imidazolonepropionase, partial [Bacteroidetes bacterium HGW-Bacteroidetes-22]
MKILIRNIGLLVNTETVPVAFRAGREMSTLHNIENAWLLTDEDRIAGFGPMSTIETILPGLDEEDNFIEIDATGRLVFPSFCDSHTHLVYAGSREIEYVDKIKGLSYEEIFERGGGILNSARLLHEASEEELVEQALDRLNEMLMYGTGAVEIKSGYGLSTEDELKMLRVIKKLKDISPLSIKATFLGAHAVPDEYKGRRQEYVNMIINEMIPMVAAEELADYIDVFCDKGFFTPEDTDRILMA